eukprot:CAMPEP_0172692672 /NCGR_PEP_ID=MMETSP1074-20121228/25429_1 /TAXON_ID=2916 /ORGANISM="Ceratium fusus, Strain PA161109" /LENGTH=67 /DNA_ID=CAMNT_0013512923 /DNA_START=22 /DNA_END=222 /DNA_ORIENTATION=+
MMLANSRRKACAVYSNAAASAARTGNPGGGSKPGGSSRPGGGLKPGVDTVSLALPPAVAEGGGRPGG